MFVNPCEVWLTGTTSNKGDTVAHQWTIAYRMTPKSRVFRLRESLSWLHVALLGDAFETINPEAAIWFVAPDDTTVRNPETGRTLTIAGTKPVPTVVDVEFRDTVRRVEAARQGAPVARKIPTVDDLMTALAGFDPSVVAASQEQHLLIGGQVFRIGAVARHYPLGVHSSARRFVITDILSKGGQVFLIGETALGCRVAFGPDKLDGLRLLPPDGAITGPWVRDCEQAGRCLNAHHRGCGTRQVWHGVVAPNQDRPKNAVGVDEAWALIEAAGLWNDVKRLPVEHLSPR